MFQAPVDRTTTADRIADLAARHEEVVTAAEKRARDRQHAKNKLTARERIDLLLDADSFVELDEFARHRCTDFGMDRSRPFGDGVVTGHGTVDGRPVCVFSQDFTVFGGSMGETFGRKVLKVMELAMSMGCPVVGINDSGGARIQEGVESLAYYAELGRLNTHASGVVPQLSMITGPCAGGAVYSPAITDFTVMVEGTSHMFVTGPDVVQAVSGDRPDLEELGGPRTNGEVSGNAHYVASDEEDAFSWVRTLLGYLPANNLEAAPSYEPEEPSHRDEELDRIVPDSEHQVYDMYEVIERIVDDGEFLESHSRFAPNMICAFARIEGSTVGVVANQPTRLAGVIDIDASEKAARFVRFCDAFNIPLLTLADVPGYLPSVVQERSGIIRRGAKLIYAYAEATVPKVTVVVRKAYGGGYAVMGSKHLGADVNIAWPTAEIAVMGARGAATILHRKQLGEAEDHQRGALHEQLTGEYAAAFANPYRAAERGHVDMVVQPSRTRFHVARSFRFLRNKRQSLPAKKHGNIPL